MAVIELILSQARRHCFTRASTQYCYLLRSDSLPNQLFPALHRPLCSSAPAAESNIQTQPDQPTKRPHSVPIQPVSYAIKSKDPSVSPPQDDSQRSTASPSTRITREPVADIEQPISSDARKWTREEIRFVKNMPSISPVSYPTRVAPLPEDRVEVKEGEAAEEEGDKGHEKERDAQLEKERRKIEADSRMIRRAFRIEEEAVPFPTLIKVEKKNEKKVIYDLKDAIQLVKANAKRNFVETIEAHVTMAADLRRSDLVFSCFSEEDISRISSMNVKGSVILPHGSGKTFRVAVFAEGAAADEAKAAGADIVGGQELVDGIKNGNIKINFDKCVTTYEFVPRVAQIAKVLRHLMPDPKRGTVSNDVAAVVKEAKQKVDFKKDKKSAVVHVGLGKVNFSDEALRENIGAFVNALLLAKPPGLKKSSKYAGYVNTFHICSTMGPSFPVSIQSLSVAADRFSRLQLR